MFIKMNQKVVQALLLAESLLYSCWAALVQPGRTKLIVANLPHNPTGALPSAAVEEWTLLESASVATTSAPAPRMPARAQARDGRETDAVRDLDEQVLAFLGSHGEFLPVE